MDLQKLVEYGRDFGPLVEGTPPWRVEPCLRELLQRQEWDLLSLLLLSVADPVANQIINALLELGVYEPLVVAACLRRHIRTQPYVLGSGRGVADRVFRDLEAEGANTAGVPDHILEDIREMAETSQRLREAQLLRGESMDRGPMREFIINRLAERLNTDPRARDALVVIARAAAWEETRRIAAIKVANHTPSIRKLAEAGRTADLLAIAQASRLEAVARNLAQVLAEHLQQLRSKGDSEALAFIAKHHPDAEVRQAAASSRPEG
jgi:hypothetical protein